MPCTKCRSDFNVFNWKIKCGECDDKYCSKCLRKRDGILYCEKCMILIKRPPDRVKLMELKPKDLQDYLNKHNISTYGLVEKHELVDLFCDKHIPDKPKRGVEKLTANFAGSVPNFRPHLNDFFENLESVFPREQSSRHRTSTTSPPRPNAHPRTQIPKPPAPPRPQAPPPTRTQPSAPPPPRPTSPPANIESEPQPTTSNTSPTTTTTESEAPTPPQPPPRKEKDTPESSPLPQKCPKLSDITSSSELNSFTSKQLKQLLTINRVDYKGCVEKSELLERAVRLWQDNQEQTKELPENVEDLCKLCMDAPLDCVLLECGHIATCIDCGKKLAECPICRQYVSRVVRTFKA